jgi:hypothetical protein
MIKTDAKFPPPARYVRNANPGKEGIIQTRKGQRAHFQGFTVSKALKPSFIPVITFIVQIVAQSAFAPVRQPHFAQFIIQEEEAPIKRGSRF